MSKGAIIALRSAARLLRRQTPFDRRWAEQAIEVEDDEALEHQAELVEAEIVSVKRALERINSGTYGERIQCGEQISPARLQARPLSCRSTERDDIPTLSLVN